MVRSTIFPHLHRRNRSDFYPIHFVFRLPCVGIPSTTTHSYDRFGGQIDRLTSLYVYTIIVLDIDETNESLSQIGSSRPDNARSERFSGKLKNHDVSLRSSARLAIDQWINEFMFVRQDEMACFFEKECRSRDNANSGTPITRRSNDRNFISKRLAPISKRSIYCLRFDWRMERRAAVKRWKNRVPCAISIADPIFILDIVWRVSYFHKQVRRGDKRIAATRTIQEPRRVDNLPRDANDPS